MYYLLMTVLSFFLLAFSFFGDGLLNTFALYAAGVFMGHTLTEALNHA